MMTLAYTTHSSRAGSRAFAAHHTEASGKRDNGLWIVYDSDGEYAFQEGDTVVVIDPASSYYQKEGVIRFALSRAKYAVKFAWNAAAVFPFRKSQLRKINKKSAPNSNIICFSSAAYRVAQNKIRMAKKITQTAAIIELPAVSQSTAHERFVAFMARLEMELPVSEWERGVKIPPISSKKASRRRAPMPKPVPQPKHQQSASARQISRKPSWIRSYAA